jgi:hypothetical protein
MIALAVGRFRDRCAVSAKEFGARPSRFDQQAGDQADATKVVGTACRAGLRRLVSLTAPRPPELQLSAPGRWS